MHFYITNAIFIMENIAHNTLCVESKKFLKLNYDK